MSKYLLNESTIQDIADAVREMNGESTLYTPSELANAILEISGGDYLKPLCFTSGQNGSTLYLQSVASLNIKLYISYNGDSWSEWLKNDSGRFNTITLNAGDKVYIKGKNSTFSSASTSYSNFYSSGKLYLSGNIMSLLDPSCKLLSLTGRNYAFNGLFSGCGGSLLSAPDLPATTLSYGCYKDLFYNCTNLKNAPFLPAKTMQDTCYSRMFYNTGLIHAPELPGTIAPRCYISMFQSCKSLIYGPTILPSTTIAQACYQSMFSGCNNLEYAPKLPALDLYPAGLYSYNYMFYNCSKLSNIKVGATRWRTTNTQNWVSGVAASGTFTKPSGTTIPTGTAGIPSGWTVVNV